MQGMSLRRAFFVWLIPAAFVLPLWLLIGWITFGASPWALLWVFISAPIVFVWELLLTLLVRARGTVRAERAVSWADVAGFGVWHALVIALGFFNPAWWWPVLAVTIVVGLGLMWLELAQLWREAKPSGLLLRTADGVGYIPPQPASPSTEGPADVFVVTEKARPDAN